MHYLFDYKTFNSTEELNKAIYVHIRNNTYDLNETDRTALKLIARYAVKYSGAAHLKAATIAELIGKSEKTARRVINKLAELGIIVKHATLRKINGGKGANIIVIQNPEESVDPNNSTKSVNDQSSVSSREVGESSCNAKAETRNNEKEPSDSINLLKPYLNTETHAVPANALRNSIPESIFNALAPFFNAEEIYRYYGLLLKAKRKYATETVIEQNEEPYVEAINAVVFKLKRNKIRNIAGYMYASFSKAATEISRLVNASNPESSILTYDWLAE